jgi:hypothetical protein
MRFCKKKISSETFLRHQITVNGELISCFLANMFVFLCKEKTLFLPKFEFLTLFRNSNNCEQDSLFFLGDDNFAVKKESQKEEKISLILT